METYVQAGFGGLLGERTLADIRRLGFTGVRLEASARGLVEEVAAAGLKPLALVKNLDWFAYVPPGTPVEFAPCEPPEPDLTMTAAGYAKAVQQALAVARIRGCPLWIGAISNLNKRGLSFLQDVMLQLALFNERRAFSISVHRYPHGDDGYTPHSGFDTRKAEVERLRRIIGGRLWGVTEFGYHTASRPARAWTLGWLVGRRRRWSDLDVARMMTWEWSFWRTAGAAFATVYQINDGPDDTALGRYGLRDYGGAWKPAATSVRSYKALWKDDET